LSCAFDERFGKQLRLPETRDVLELRILEPGTDRRDSISARKGQAFAHLSTWPFTKLRDGPPVAADEVAGPCSCCQGSTFSRRWHYRLELAGAAVVQIVRAVLPIASLRAVERQSRP